MDTGEAPQWLTTAGIIGTMIGTSIGAIWVGRKEKAETVTPGGMAQVVTASFVDKAALDRNTENVAANNELLRQLIELLTEAAEARREDRVRRDQQERDALTAAVKALADKGVSL